MGAARANTAQYRKMIMMISEVDVFPVLVFSTNACTSQSGLSKDTPPLNGEPHCGGITTLDITLLVVVFHISFRCVCIGIIVGYSASV